MQPLIEDDDTASGPKQQLKNLAKAVMPPWAHRFIQVKLRGRDYHPGKGRVDFGDLRRLDPLSREYGYDRGRPVDRYYIESFLEREKASIKGRVLEIGENTYTLRFGGDRVEKSDVLHYNDDDPPATFVGDLTNLPDLPSTAFDCVIITQTLHLIYDMKAALATIYRVLKPGGILLCTVPGITQISDSDWNDTWYWSLSVHSARRVVAEIFPKEWVEVASFGNVLSAISFLQGLSDDELTREELDHNDPEYQLLITIKAKKPDATFTRSMSQKWAYGDAPQFAYGEQTSYEKGIAFLDGHGEIEDWGCGTAFARKLVKSSTYVGIDGSQSPHADKTVDLQTYRSTTDCIFMRHVLEHNWGWRRILDNALSSFQKRMVLIVFTPLDEGERLIGRNGDIPDLALDGDEIRAILAPYKVTEEALTSDTEYGAEHIFYIEKAA